MTPGEVWELYEAASHALQDLEQVQAFFADTGNDGGDLPTVVKLRGALAKTRRAIEAALDREEDPIED